MITTYVLGGAALGVSFGVQDRTGSAYWLAAGAVGITGILSFVRHAVFHRSDAARMHWDLGRRNDFQIEVGIANLAWGVVGVACWLLALGPEAAGAVALVFGIYLLGAAVLHGAELRRPVGEGGGRVVPTAMTALFAVLVLVAAVLVLRG